MARTDDKPIILKDARAVVVVGTTTTELPRGSVPEAAGDRVEHGVPPADQTVEREHRASIGEREITYRSTAGTLTLRDDEGQAKARMFYVAYVRTDAGDSSSRPITFCFNGGPGSSSVWLHLGAFGPRRVPLPDDAAAPAPRYRLEDNEGSILDQTDLVFIDPVSTGFSRPEPGEDARPFHGVTGDVASVGDFIRLYTTRHGRWLSPKFLAGESYGTTRAAALALHLQERHGLFVSGLLLISSVLQFQTLHFLPDNDLPHLVILPSYAATAWYHGRLDRRLQGDGSPAALRRLLDEAEAFALGDYARALLLGSRLSEADRRRIAARYARLTGLAPDYVLGADLRVSLGRFCKSLLRAQGRTVGRLDSRYQGIDRDRVGETFEYDASMSAIMGPYTAALNHYLRAELGWESDLPYEILTGKVQPWDFDPARNRFLDVAEPLRQAISRNPHLKVIVANGVYDLATPYFATAHTFSHLGLDPGLRDNIRMTFYPAGHMMYVHRPSLLQLKADLGAYYAWTLAAEEDAEAGGPRGER